MSVVTQCLLLPQISLGINTRIFIDSFASAIVISVLNAVLPLVFELVAKIEKFKTRSGEITITLLR